VPLRDYSENTMEQIVLIIHILAALGVIIFILLQQGKGAEVGASFGSGASQTIFGSQGSGNFLTRTTAILITVFFVTSLTLGYLASNSAKPQDLDELLEKAQQSSAPAKVTKESPLKGSDIPR
jgi:preprotein translocase subunit SecG